jgi:hypothetical protein
MREGRDGKPLSPGLAALNVVERELLADTATILGDIHGVVVRLEHGWDTGHCAEVPEVVEGVGASRIRDEQRVNRLRFGGNLLLNADNARGRKGLAEDALGKLVEAGTHSDRYRSKLDGACKGKVKRPRRSSCDPPLGDVPPTSRVRAWMGRQGRLLQRRQPEGILIKNDGVGESVRGAVAHAARGAAQRLFARATNALADRVLYVRREGAEIVVG